LHARTTPADREGHGKEGQTADIAEIVGEEVANVGAEY
jgi:hypothetical protein